MTPERAVSLPSAPRSVDDVHGHPRFGTYQGELDEVALERLRGAWSLPFPFRIAKHKRWSYAQVVTPEVIAVFAIADFTYASNAFVSVVDLRTQMVVHDEGYLGLPPARVKVGDRPSRGHEASFKRPGAKLEIRRGRSEEDPFRIDLSSRSLLPFAESLDIFGVKARFEWRAEVETRGAPPALTVISPVEEDGVINVTQKRAALRASGTLTAGRHSWSLDGGVAGLDYTHGYLARHTAWRWAMGNGRLEDGTAIGFNLVEGFNEANPSCNENALWVGDALLPLGRARFHFDKDAPERPWEVETTDGAVKLRFQPLHLHREDRDLRLVRSHFVQPLGIFSGTLRAGGKTFEVSNLGGVTEDQDILW